MCGIAGYFAPQQTFGGEVLEQMTSCLAHRGPDADGFFRDNTVGFGHRRLSIIDLSSAANQPMHSRDGRWVMMFNGEVFNFHDIARELAVPLRSHSDTEVMVESFAKWGPGAVSRFNGMFTIALYDKSEQILFLFRDRLGVKPLYYTHYGHNLFFASELKAITKVNEVSEKLQLNHEAVSSFLQFGYIPEPLTIWREVRKFPAGYFMKITKEGTELQAYWKAEDAIRPDVVTDTESAKENLSSLLESAIQYRMISDVPFGTFLSGGIDSSLVTAFAQKNSNHPVRTFTIAFKEKKYNEAIHAAKVASYLKTDHHEFTLTYQEAIVLVEESMDIFDEPFADSSAIPTMLLSKYTREKVKMVLTGDGGDELFMGYGAYRWANRLNNSFIKTFRYPIASLLSMGGNRSKRAAHLFRYGGKENLPLHIFSQEQYLFSEKESGDMLHREFNRHYQVNGHAKNLSRSLLPNERQAFFDLKFYLKDDLLVKVDRASMRYGLECRTPFLDFRIVEFALNVSEKLKMKGNELKILPRLLLRDHLPADLFERPKWGFAIPLKEWLKSELKYLIDNYLNEEIVTDSHMVNWNQVLFLKKRFFAGEDYLYNRLWNLIVLHRWLQKNLPVT